MNEPDPATAAEPGPSSPPSDQRRPTPVRRRAVLTAAAGALGIAVGAGGVEAAHVLTPNGPGVGPHVASPGEALMTEHGVLKRILLAYRTVGDRLAAGQPVSAGVVVDAAQIISDYVESFHEGLEEAYVFPRVAAHKPELIRTLLTQHDRGRHLTAAIQSVATHGLDAPNVRKTLGGYLAAFVRMYEPHEAWEDTVVFPTLRRTTPQRTLDLLAEHFADLEHKQYGDDALAALLDRVTGIEQHLHIADLATFTPAL